jgi:hypothetical protein
MKTSDSFSGLQQNSLTSHELNNIRGGNHPLKGGSTHIDEDILLPDPVETGN